MRPAGSAAVDWLVSVQFALTRVEAVTLGSALVEMGLLQPVGLRSVEALRSAGLSQQLQDDSTALYSFVGAAAAATTTACGVQSFSVHASVLLHRPTA